MKKYILERNDTGVCKVNTDAICKDWNERFSISAWINSNEEKYTLVIKGKSKNTIRLKAEIPTKEALLIIEKCSLVRVKSVIFSSGLTYYSKQFIDSEIERLTAQRQEKQLDIDMLDNVLGVYKTAIES